MSALATTPYGRAPIPPMHAWTAVEADGDGAEAREAVLRDPASGEVLAHIAEQSAAEVRAAVARARAAQRSWGDRPVAERARLVLEWRRRLLAEAEALSEALQRQTGRPANDALLLEVLPAAHLLGHVAGRARRILAPERLWPRLPSRVAIRSMRRAAWSASSHHGARRCWRRWRTPRRPSSPAMGW